MTDDLSQLFARVFLELEKNGLLLVSGTEITDIRRLVSKSPPSGSWWNDPKANSIFAIGELLEDHPDVVVAKIVAKKVTFIHRRLWSELFAVATSRADWQMKGLSSTARKVLIRLDKEQTADSTTLTKAGVTKPSNVTRELEYHLLIHSAQVHTSSGKHAKVLQSWTSWADSISFMPRTIEATAAADSFEKCVSQINPTARLERLLPWITTSK